MAVTKVEFLLYGDEDTDELAEDLQRWVNEGGKDLIGEIAAYRVTHFG